MGDSGAQFMVVGDCVRALPCKIGKIKASSQTDSVQLLNSFFLLDVAGIYDVTIRNQSMNTIATITQLTCENMMDERISQWQQQSTCNFHSFGV